MVDLIIILIITVVILLAVRYIYKVKKSGHKCIGCPNNHNCNKQKKLQL